MASVKVMGLVPASAAVVVFGLGIFCNTTRHLATSDGVAQMARVEVNQNGFHPPTIDVRRGMPFKLELLRTTDATCATTVVFPEERIERDLPLGIPVRIEIAADQAREITFQCGMGIYRGSVVVR